MFVDLRVGGCVRTGTQPDAVRSCLGARQRAKHRYQAIRCQCAAAGRLRGVKRSSAQVTGCTTTMRGVALCGNTSGSSCARKPPAIAERIIIEDMAPQTAAPSSIPLRALRVGRRAMNPAPPTTQQGRERLIMLDAEYHSTSHSGWVLAFQNASAGWYQLRFEGTYDPKKFLGGYDLVSDDYNSAQKETSIPHPDNNPLDCSVRQPRGGHCNGLRRETGRKLDLPAARL